MGELTTKVVNATVLVTCCILLFRLARLRLDTAYRPFYVFLLLEVVSQTVSYAVAFVVPSLYSVVWITLKLLYWLVFVWMVYSLAGLMLRTLPGVLKFSYRILGFVFVLALLGGAISALVELGTANGSDAGRVYNSGLFSGDIRTVLVLDRTISTVVFIVLVAMMLFLLWFPVQLPRNVIGLSTGLAVYFGAKTALLLIRSFVSHDVRSINTALGLLFISCFVFWTVFLTREGEVAPVQIGHAWRTQDRDRVLHQLNAINTSLLRSSKR